MLATIARNNAHILSLGVIVDIDAIVQRMNATVPTGVFNGKVKVKVTRTSFTVNFEAYVNLSISCELYTPVQ